MLNILNNIPLKPYNTFGVNVIAKQFLEINSKEKLVNALKTHSNSKKFILGGGSNMLLTKNINALVLHINNKGIIVIEDNDTHVFVKVEAGEVWHEFVLWCIKNNYGGVENLSLIPGNVGTSPIQNIGAYGVELKDVFFECEAINIKTFETKVFSNEDCKFDYRNSVFKQEAKGKFVITNVTFKLTKPQNHLLNISYGAIISELEKNNIKNPTIKDVSDAIIKIRQSKLPDPKEIGNSGSFFKNPIIQTAHFKKLQENFSEIPSYKISDTEIKIPAGWLIEQAGFKGKRFYNYGVHKNQALVLVNYGNADGNDILNLSILIQKTIKRLFNINLETEVNII